MTSLENPMPTTDPVRNRPTVTQYAAGSEPYQDASRGTGWVTFAAVLLGVLGTLNLIDGIAAVSNSTFFVDDAKYILSDLNTWGWVLIVLGVTQALAAIGVAIRATGVRWVGVTLAALNAMAQMFFLPAYPLWAVSMFLLDILVIYALVVHGARSDRD
jgi:hypothetical protein